MSGARTLVVGVDGLDFDVVNQLRATVPTLYSVVAGSQPHASVFPPDSVPSWTSIVTGLAPEQHGQLTNVKFFLEDAAESSVNADLNAFSDLCFWEKSEGDDIAIINPFLAYPPWAPSGTGAMVSGPPFSEQEPVAADPRSLLVGPLPRRMGGFAKIPTRSDLPDFCRETLDIGQEQFDFALRQLQNRRWDAFFFTTLVIDRVEHYTWRHYDKADGSVLSRVIPDAHRQLDRFLAQALETLSAGDQLLLISDHGHGRRATIGVNLQEVLRRHGLYTVASSSSSLKRRLIEAAKTMAYTSAPFLRAEDPMIALARRIPAKRALKSGTFVGSPTRGSAMVVDLAGTNPFGGIRVPDEEVAAEVVRVLGDLTHRGRRVVRWIAPCESVLTTGGNPDGLYPDLLFELAPDYGPTWNLYGAIFAPVLTRRRQSGGHTRRAVCAGMPALTSNPRDSIEVNRLILDLISRDNPRE